MKPEIIGLITVAVVLCGALGVTFITPDTPEKDPCVNPNMAQTKICQPYNPPEPIPEPVPEPEPEPAKPTEPDCIDRLNVKIFRITPQGEWLVYEGNLACLNIDIYKNHSQFTLEYENGFRV